MSAAGPPQGAKAPPGGREPHAVGGRGGDTLIEKYLEHVRVGKRLAERTVELYALDLARLQDHAHTAGVDLLQVQTAHIRRWVAQMHGGGRSGRGIALILSGWRGFYTWLGREGQVTHNPVVDVRAPKSPRPLPKALSVDDAVQLAGFQDGQANPWREARDAALVELLYGAGLRVGELVGLDLVASAAARGWVDADAGEAHVLGKGSKRRTVPVGRQALEALSQGVLSADSLKLSPALQRKLAPSYDDRTDAMFGEMQPVETDFSIDAFVTQLRKALLAQLTSDGVANRLLDSVGKLPPGDAFPVSELYARLRADIWSELASAADIAPARRELQREHLNRIASQVLRPTAAKSDTRSLMRAEALALQKSLRAAAARSGWSAEVRAHLQDSLDLLSEALAAKMQRAGL